MQTFRHYHGHGVGFLASPTKLVCDDPLFGYPDVFVVDPELLVHLGMVNRWPLSCCSCINVGGIRRIAATETVIAVQIIGATIGLIS